MCTCIYIYIYTHIYTYICIGILLYIYIYRERERELTIPWGGSLAVLVTARCYCWSCLNTCDSEVGKRGWINGVLAKCP